jgi:prepilin-type N-terminal cleavage/methylation domain-containing protein
VRPIVRTPTRSASSGGFTLAEVAVTIVIVGIALVLLIQGLGGAKAQAYYTRNLKLADQLARMTLGEVAAGRYAEDAEFGLEGTYANEDYPEFSYEVFFGEENFPSDGGSRRNDDRHDSWTYQRERDLERREIEERNDTTNRAGEDEDEEPREPYQEIMVRVSFPASREYANHRDVRAWIPWDQVYGPEEVDENSGTGSGTGNGQEGGSSGTPGTGGGRTSGTSGARSR